MTTFRQIASVLLWVLTAMTALKAGAMVYITYGVLELGEPLRASTNFMVGLTGVLTIVTIILALCAMVTWEDAK
jgi:hypothetical protein